MSVMVRVTGDGDRISTDYRGHDIFAAGGIISGQVVVVSWTNEIAQA